MNSIRLSLAPKDTERLLCDPLFSGILIDRKHRMGTCYDTEDGMLRRQGFRLEVHAAGRHWVQVFQGEEGGSKEAVHEVESGAVDRTKLPVHGKTGRRLAELLGDRALLPVFRFDLRRSVWDTAPNVIKANAILERGAISAGDRRAPVCELLLRLEEGSPGGFYDWLLDLAERYPFGLEDLDPIDRGYALAISGIITHRKADAIELAPEASAEEAFVQIIYSCLTHHRANRAAALDGQVEGVHQMRVALRRLRSCLKIFRPLIPKESSAELVAEMRWLNSFLGPARDWDVFIEEGLSPMLARCPDKRGLRVLRSNAEAIRKNHYRDLGSCLGDPHYHRLILKIYAWLAGRTWRKELSETQRDLLDGPAVDFATQVLKRNHRRVVKRGRRFDQLGKEERHDLRIRVKQLRYAMEFFAGFYPGKPVSRYRQALTGLQDCLGVMNDITVAHRLLDEAGLKPAAATRHLIDGWYACKLDVHEQGFARAWKRFEGCRRPWKKR